MDRKATIIVQNKDYPGGSDIDVGFNGKNYKIQEGKTVVVPEGVLRNLQNAVIKTPKTDGGGNLKVDENGQQIYNTFERFFITVLEDPDKPKGGRPSKAVLEARRIATENEEKIKAAEEAKAAELEKAEELENDHKSKGFFEKFRSE